MTPKSNNRRANFFSQWRYSYCFMICKFDCIISITDVCISMTFLSRVSILTCDIHIALLSVRLSELFLGHNIHKLEGRSVERMYLWQRCFDGSLLSEWNHCKTTPRCNDQYVYVGFSRRRIPRSMAYTIAEKAIRFWHPDYNPDRTQKLISSSMSRHLSTRNISSKSVHAFLSNLANRQTDKRGQTHLPPPLSEVMIVHY